MAESLGRLRHILDFVSSLFNPLFPDLEFGHIIAFIQIGTAVTIIAFGQWYVSRRNLSEDERRDFNQAPADARQYIQLLDKLTLFGAIYFAAAPFLLLLAMFSDNGVSRFLRNFVIVTVLVGSLMNAVLYVRFRVQTHRRR